MKRKPPPKTIWVIWEVFENVEYYWSWFITRAEARRYWKNHHPDLKFVIRKYVLE